MATARPSYQIELRFDRRLGDFPSNLSAMTTTPDGDLWVASDEMTVLPDETEVNTLARFSSVSASKSPAFEECKEFRVKDLLNDFNDGDGEIDIEGIDQCDHYLWLLGSHSSKRKNYKPKGSTDADTQFQIVDNEAEIQKLEKCLKQIKTEPNRYFLARIPINQARGLEKSCPHPDDTSTKLTAACLQKTAKGSSNLLLDKLKQDPHIGPFLSARVPETGEFLALPGKDNGFDIEGLAVQGSRIFLGLRGPVLRGWSVILEIEVKEHSPGILKPKKIGTAKQRYKKHFIKLGGLGIRELCFCGEDLLILAGPTMDLDGPVRVFRLRDGFNRSGDGPPDPKRLTLELDLPFGEGTDHAEGMALLPTSNGTIDLLVVYDSPDSTRRLSSNIILADVFRLN